MGFDKLNFSIAELPAQSCLSNYYFIEGPLSVISFLVLELLDSKGLYSVWSPDVLQCVSHGPSLTHLCDLERPLAGR